MRKLEDHKFSTLHKRTSQNEPSEQKKAN